ncbi:hypothetical protein COCC4DRAFT_150601 [Bipolaris maydis ATCC 48331]|uniref:Uncharacterized protein n=1 Tax=Cochliobolus heterostrophus (strain C4 / ATCC 48331 / race T) TaxID=665024 RepID=N4X1H7_COCH4|nr:uncharacterized protein COCC4DRAFT_150601 [Bipolaris maydis ATCC 48331]ENI00446.1 hypothetical protein COCC4DRAFT_150601 [Bipolaris maydis ATCC 48331]KAJ5021911.1 hypothetical protein J3E73DRAFT_394414 [Bipolaris maydis]KAJ6275493.1 hypothetical protein PSV08DRAFT_367103 [Bipolaris maydis]
MEFSDDITLATHKANCFRGLVRVHLDCLQFEHQLFLNKHREVSPQNVRRLQKIFEKTGCLRLQDENVIDAVVENDRLDAALRAIGLSIEALQNIRSPKDAPTLNLRELKCLNGLHRIRAADQFLDENDKWWVVRLFSRETPTPILCHIVESYKNEQRPSDGEIFRRIRLYHRENKVEAERKWWARLDNSKPKDLRQLFKRTEIISSFDKLLEMPGLWAKVQLGALHRLLTLKCDEEMAYYLNHVSKVWTKILTCRNITLPFSAVDTVTVDNLESLAPKNSSVDKAFVMDLFERNIVFPSLLDSQIRRELAENICASEGLIPSLWTFFETLKYIEPICEVLKKLIGGNMKRTIRSSLMGCYFPPEKRYIQVAKFREAEITSLLSQEEAAWISYVELWAFCGRYFNKLSSFTPKKESGEEKPIVEGPNPVLWQHLADFSISRGFKTKSAQKLANSDPYTELAQEYLRKSSPLSSSSHERQVQEVVRASRIVEDDSQQPQLVASGHLEKERRNGRPYENDLRMDEQNLYLPNIYNSREPTEAGWTLIRRDVFKSLFGNLTVEVCILVSSIYLVSLIFTSTMMFSTPYLYKVSLLIPMEWISKQKIYIYPARYKV